MKQCKNPHETYLKGNRLRKERLAEDEKRFQEQLKQLEQPKQLEQLKQLEEGYRNMAARFARLGNAFKNHQLRSNNQEEETTNE